MCYEPWARDQRTLGSEAVLLATGAVLTLTVCLVPRPYLPCNAVGINRLGAPNYRIIWFTPPSLDYTPTQYIAPCNYPRSLNVYIYTPMGVCM